MSTHGIRTYTPAGALAFDSTQRLGRVLGIITTGVSNGSYLYAGAVNGQFMAALLDATPGAPGISVSGQTVTWSYQGALARRSSSVVLFCF